MSRSTRSATQKRPYKSSHTIGIGAASARWTLGSRPASPNCDMNASRVSSGESALPPIVLPVELSDVADAVDNFADVCVALRRTVQLCETLGNQMAHLANTYCHRIALIQNLMLRVIPLPLPCNHPRRDELCFWRREPMRYETQARAQPTTCKATPNAASTCAPNPHEGKRELACGLRQARQRRRCPDWRGTADHP
eukprot:2798800-Pleurochrysis_carterae.AAC.1